MFPSGGGVQIGRPVMAHVLRPPAEARGTDALGKRPGVVLSQPASNSSVQRGLSTLGGRSQRPVRRQSSRSRGKEWWTNCDPSQTTASLSSHVSAVALRPEVSGREEVCDGCDSTISCRRFATALRDMVPGEVTQDVRPGGLPRRSPSSGSATSCRMSWRRCLTDGSAHR